MDASPRELTYAQAIQEAMALAMEADERVFLMGGQAQARVQGTKVSTLL